MKKKTTFIKRGSKYEVMPNTSWRTLAELVAAEGSQERAAKYIGCSFSTLNRWLKGHFNPGNFTQKELRRLHITLR